MFVVAVQHFFYSINPYCVQVLENNMIFFLLYWTYKIWSIDYDEHKLRYVPYVRYTLTLISAISYHKHIDRHT